MGHTFFYKGKVKKVMNDTEARRQIDQMVNFVINEAKDRASEIESATLEQFSIEKLKKIQAGKEKHRKEVELKIKQIKTKKIVEESQENNRCRLRRAAAREKVLQKVKNDTSKMMESLHNDPSKYGKLLAELVVQ